MKLTVKNRFFSELVFDENNNLVCRIKRKHFLGPAKLVYQNDKVIYITDIVKTGLPEEAGHKYIVYDCLDNSKVAASASLLYPSDVNNKALHKLPQSEEMQIRSCYGDFIIKKLNNNMFEIQEQKKSTGSIIYSPLNKQKSISCSSIGSKTFLATIYTLFLYMLREDDLIAI